MGREQRAREATEHVRRKRRFVWVKAIAGFLLILPLVPFATAYACYRDNHWPWENWI